MLTSTFAGLAVLLIGLARLLFQNCGRAHVSQKDSEILGSTGNNISNGSTKLNCTFDGKPIDEEASITAYPFSAVPFGQMCVSEKRTCVNGSLSGSAKFSSCAVGAAAACLFDGVTILDGQHVEASKSSSVAFGEACVSESRVCKNGVLSGTFQFSSCAVAVPAMCLFNGLSMANGQSVKAFSAATVPYGQVCSEQIRTCTNGNLSGQYAESSCVVSPKPLPDIKGIAAGNGHTCVIHKGALKCWGSNSQGQIGDGTTVDRAMPVTIFQSGATDISIRSAPGYGSTPVKIVESMATKVAISEEGGTCAVVNSQVICFQYGAKTPYTIVFNSGATEIVAGQYHFCATVDGNVKCWGRVTTYNWGHGDKPITETPIIKFNGPVKRLSGAVHFACAIFLNDDLHCSGETYSFVTLPATKIASNVSFSSGCIGTMGCLTWVSNKQLFLHSLNLGWDYNSKNPTPDYK